MIAPRSYVHGCLLCPQLPRSCQTFKIRNGSQEQTIYIVGTAHVSAASCDDVRDVIRAVKPEVRGLTHALTHGLSFTDTLTDQANVC